jgi:hypothetical protein
LASTIVVAWAASRPYVLNYAIEQDTFKTTDVFYNLQTQTANDCKTFAAFTCLGWVDAMRHAHSILELGPVLDYVPFFGYTVAKNAFYSDSIGICGHAVSIMVRKDIAMKWMGCSETSSPLQGDRILIGDGTVLEDSDMALRASAEAQAVDAFAKAVHALTTRPFTSMDEALVANALVVRVHEVWHGLETHMNVCAMVCNWAACPNVPRLSPPLELNTFNFFRSDGSACYPTFAELLSS